MRGYGYTPHFVVGDEPAAVHQELAATLDTVLDDIARSSTRPDRALRTRPAWPMIVLRTPKGWTGPKEVDGKQVEGTFRAHQVPLAGTRDQRRAPGPARGVDAQLPARGAVRRRRAARPGARARSRPRATGG